MTVATMQRVLFLGPADSPLVGWLRAQGEAVLATMKPVGPRFVARRGFTFLVSYGYRHIVRPEVLALLPGRAVNLHISLLPWNRGADPNFWSFIDDTPKGVTIHHLDSGIDTGDIIAQEEVRFDVARETLATSYATLQARIQALFRRHWPAIRAGRAPRRPQVGAGSAHRSADKAPLLHLLTDGWDTPVSVLLAHGARRRQGGADDG